MLCVLAGALSSCDCGGVPPGGDPDSGGSRIDAAASDATALDSGARDQVTPDSAGQDLSPGVDRRVGTPDANDPGNALRDSDCDGLSDEEEFGNVYAGDLRTDPASSDSDGDGVLDGVELGRTSSPDARCAALFVADADPTTTTDPTRADSDGDGLCDGSRDVGTTCAAGEDRNNNGRVDSGESDPRHLDTDRDGLCDGARTVSPICVGGDPDPLHAAGPSDRDGDGLLDDDDDAPDDPDRDGDGLCDGFATVSGVCVEGEDRNGDGTVSAGETDPDRVDSDCDGLTDLQERQLLTDPLKQDSDGDGISDGVEAGVAVNPDPANCPTLSLDAAPATTTDPRDRDSDGDGLPDGLEDRNQNGQVDPGETDPGNADSDGDRLCDGPARTILGVCAGGEDLNGNGALDFGETDPAVDNSTGSGGLSPNDPNNAFKDSDCDGLSDAEEYGNVYAGGLQTDPGNADSDGDGIPDGVELGRQSSPDARCTASFAGDQDPATQTSPTRPDSDGDGLCDGPGTVAGVCVGGEDLDANGRRDPGELDPRHPDSDGDHLCDGPGDVPPICAGGDPDPFDPGGVIDSDRDGIPDAVEQLSACLDPSDPDSDGDGLCDGPRGVAGVCVAGEDLDANGVLSAGETDPCRVDSDCDGLSDQEERQLGTNPGKKDSDGDLILDGVELGRTQNLDPVGCPAFVGATAPANPTNPLQVDSDGDGINDGIEDANRNGRLDSGETDPNDPDTDGDGTCDGPPRVFAGVCTGGEDLNANGRVDPGETDPRVAGAALLDSDHDGIPDAIENTIACLDADNPDSDGDGLCDGPLAVSGTCATGEDLNSNGRVDVGESDPCRVDSDCDGLVDGVSYGDFLGERTLGTSASNPDTDADGLGDGLEAGVAGVAVPPGTDASCGFAADADPATTTNPLLADTDSDGVPDGAEDQNQNGRVDCADGSFPPSGDLDDCAGGRRELDPNNTSDATGPVGQACTGSNLIPVQFMGASAPDLLLATATYGGSDAFSERSTLTLDGVAVGVMLYNPQHHVALFALSLVPGAGDTTASAAEVARRSVIGNLSNAIARTFTTWDGFAGAVLASYDDAGTGNVKTRTSTIVQRLLPAGVLAGTLTSGGDAGPFELQLEYVRRTDQRLVVLGALIPAARYSGVSVFRADDVANGSALAQAGDQVGVQCDTFAVAPPQNVDFVLVIDNSGSMSNEQNAVATAATEMGLQLSSSTVDWRVAVITSDLDYQGNSQSEWARREHPQATLAISSVNDDGGSGRVRVTTNPASGYSVGDDLFVWDTTNYNGQYTVRTAGNPFECSDGNGTSNTDPESSGWVRRAERYCAFTTSTAELSDCVSALGIRGSGEENFFRAVACAMGRTVRGAGIDSDLDTANGELGGAVDGESCGRDANRAPYPATNTYATPPGSFALLPRQDGSPNKLRTDARLAVIFITDANEQSDGRYSRASSYPGDAIATHSVPTWVSFFNNFDGQGTGLSRAFVAGLVCPNGSNCTDETGDYMNPRFQQFFTAMGGIEAQLPGDSDPQQTQKIADAIRSILQQVIGSASPYTLTKPPISSTIRVALDAATVGACDVNNVPRSRQDGWDYDGATGNIVFYGDCRPVGSTSDTIAVSYRYWIDRSGDPGGTPDPCDCTPPEVCDPDTQLCYCPADCGMGSLPPQQVCDTTACEVVCRPDCGGGCSGASECNPAPGVCACECPADCGGPAPGPAFVCDRNLASPTFCLWICQQCPGAPPNPAMTCDPVSCAWGCPDCGACPGLARCSDVTCACECGQSMTCGAGYRWDAAACDCVCDATRLGCVAPYTADLAACACVCDADCGGACAADRVCNRSTCQCVCPPDCNAASIPPQQVCDTQACALTCRPDCGGLCDGNLRCNSDPAVCACECPENCGGAAPGPGFVCDRDPASTSYCQWTCPSCPGTPPNPSMICDPLACEWTCPDCGTCPGYATCSDVTCACECPASGSCAPGYTWDTTACECLCDVDALACSGSYQADPALCACVCKPECGGCPSTMYCNQSLCVCLPRGG